MKIKKIAAVAAAAAVLVAAAPMAGVLTDPLSVVASAAEEKLITAPYPDGITYWDFYALGNGYFYTGGYGLPSKVIRVGDEEIEQLRKTGTFTYTDVESEVDLSNISFYSDVTIKDGYAYVKSDDKYYIMKVDESSNKLVKVYEFSDGRNWSRSDGYGFSKDIDYETGVCTYTVYDPDGKKIENTLTYTSSGKGDYDSPSCGFYECESDKYLGFMTWKLPGTIVQGTEADDATAQYDIYGIKKDGSHDVIAAGVRSYAYDDVIGLIVGSSDNYIAWQTDDDITIYTIDDGKTNKISRSLLKYGDEGAYIDVETVFGSKAVILSKGDWRDQYYAQLVDISGEGKVLLDFDGSVETIDDGNMYYYQRYYDYFKFGFLDSTGKAISEWYDRAENFENDNLYTWVGKDDKYWLIDRNMNQVSEKIDSSSFDFAVYGNEFFSYGYEDENGDHIKVFATFANKVEPSQPTKPTTPEEPAVKTVEYADEATGIKASANEGVVADGAEFTATPVAEETKDNKLVYDFKFTKDGKEVQPNGSVTVKIPVPEALKGKTVYVYRAENDGTYTKMNAEVEGDLITFTTGHFSKYLVTDEVIEGAKAENPATGIPGTALAIAAIAFAGAGMIVARKKRR